MEKMIDFDEWLANYIPEPTKYVAVFDPETGAVKSVGPDHAFTTEKNKISLDTETAESIINSEIMIHKCFVDIDSSSLEIAETKSIFKIDDVLHRISSIEFSDIIKPDVYLAYSSKNKTLKIQLSAELGGTKKVKGDIKKRKIVWDGDTEMNFLITEYNDPNLIFEMFSVKINELVGKTKTVKDIDYENFSVYTRRLFKNYVIEYK
jgi:hypothetical protein|tara:strand:+ start:3051 stop:3668 length:618 start_codon:yes stop_codon:yes gene_type:complete